MSKDCTKIFATFLSCIEINYIFALLIPKLVIMKNLIFYLFLFSTVFIQSCATVFSGTKCKVSVNEGLPYGSKVYLNGNYVANAPCKVEVSKNSLKNQCFIEIKSEGYESQKIVLVRKVKVAAVIGNIIFTGGLGLILDFADGAIYKAFPNKVNYNLSKKEEEEN